MYTKTCGAKTSYKNNPIKMRALALFASQALGGVSFYEVSK